LLFSQLRQDGVGRGRPAGRADGRLVRRLVGLLTGSGERRVRLRTLTMIRWIAIIGQAFTVALVHFSLEVRLPLGPLLGAIGLSAAINLILSGFAATTRLTERSAGLLLGFDILQLAFLLALTGGLQNPFSILLIVPVTLSASTLSLRTTVVLCLMVVAAATLLALFPTDLPWYHGTFRLPALYVGALWLALVLGTVLVAGYAWRVADEARRLSDALAATQMALAREQQLSALGGLAAAAAHELGSPLATIAVTARELANSVPDDSPLAEDVALLVSEGQRCREILRSLSHKGESEEHAPFTRMPLSTLLETVAESCRRRPEIDLVTTLEQSSAASGEPRLVPTPELRHALANLIDNAVQFAEREVRIVAALGPTRVAVRIEDDGPGFPAEVKELLGEPYFSTRREAGGLGLGVFIAQTLLARTGATLQFDNRDHGARVTITWSRAALEGGAPEI
jgi:two-component system, sensor histidine kinase RegB